jgi:hypothetical protein
MSRKPTKVPGDSAPSGDLPEADDFASESQTDLPNAIDVDPNAIPAPVLSKQGWVVPVDTKNPNAPR